MWPKRANVLLGVKKKQLARMQKIIMSGLHLRYTEEMLQPSLIEEIEEKR